MGIAYRLRQLRDNLTAGPLTAAARAEISGHLSSNELELFFRFSPADQWHSYRVLRTLKEAGYNHPDLGVAALLHDIGKCHSQLSIWDRTVIVIGSAVFSSKTGEWGRGSLDSWRRPFVIRAQHPAWGAAMAAAAGSRPEVVELIERHQDKVERIERELDQLLVCLQWADDQN